MEANPRLVSDKLVIARAYCCWRLSAVGHSAGNIRLEHRDSNRTALFICDRSLVFKKYDLAMNLRLQKMLALTDEM